MIVPTARWVGAVLLLSAVLDLTLRTQTSWAILVASVEVAFAVPLLAVGILARGRTVPRSAANPLAALLFFAVVLVTTLAVTVSGDPGGEAIAYMALIATFTGLLFLSWPWLVGSLLAASAMAAFIATSGGSPIVGGEAIILMATGLAGGAIVHAVRLRQFHATSDAIRSARDANARLDAVVTHSPVGILVVDLGTERIVSANRAAEVTLGRERGELVGVEPSSFVRSDDVAAYQEAARRQLEHPEEASEADWHMRTTAGETRDVHVRNATIRSTDGASLCILIMEDVTEKRKLEAALRRAERDTMLGTVVAGVAHEINNPLQIMGGSLDLLEMDLDALARSSSDRSDPLTSELAQMRETLRPVRRGMEQIARITRALDQVTRGSHGTRAAVDPDHLLGPVLLAARPRLGEGIRIVQQLEARGRPTVDEPAITQIILNLVLNAAEALRHKGTIILRTRDEPAGVLVEVEDDGPGIPAEVASQIFIPFFTMKAEGTGLALSISRRTAEAHGGSLTFESRPGRTVFRLRLPVAPSVSVPLPHA